MANPLDHLLPGTPEPGTRYLWGTVINPASPITVRIDNETTPLYINSNAAGGLVPGQRVLVLIQGRDRTIIGPPRQADWMSTPYISPWGPANGSWASQLRFCVEPGNVVRLRGRASGNAAPIARIPVGYRPVSTPANGYGDVEPFLVDSPSGPRRVAIYSTTPENIANDIDGLVFLADHSSKGAGEFVSFMGITYKIG